MLKGTPTRRPAVKTFIAANDDKNPIKKAGHLHHQGFVKEACDLLSSHLNLKEQSAYIYTAYLFSLLSIESDITKQLAEWEEGKEKWSQGFRENWFPEENESDELSNGEVVKLSGSVKNQKLLEVEPLPYYFHRKMKLILQHNYILIDGQQWEKEEPYEMESLNEKYPLEKATAWLTQKDDSYFTNVYGIV